jgi:exopolysaccharide production protein ExoY
MTMNFPEFLPGKSGQTRDVGLSEMRSPAMHGPLPLPSSQRFGLYRNGLKRLFDIAAIVLAAPFVAPLLGLLAVVTAADGGSPLYSQLRVGKGGREFRMLKFRTMVHDAERKLEAHLAADPEARREWDETQKLQNDPRVTRVGRFLRSSSLDELPQLWNVLCGDMSLVGPRPMMVQQQAMYPGNAYYLLRPGITGHWQTAGRNRTSFEARAAFDAAYEQELSLATDLRILARTVTTVVNCTGV